MYHKARRAAKVAKKEPKINENAKTALFIKGKRVPKELNQALTELVSYIMLT